MKGLLISTLAASLIRAAVYLPTTDHDKLNWRILPTIPYVCLEDSQRYVIFTRGEGEAEKRETAMGAFDSIDEDKSGLVSKEELWTYIHAKESNMTESEFNRLFKMIDQDGSNEIDFAEFLMFMGKLDGNKN